MHRSLLPLLLIVMLFFVACKRSPYVSHKVKLENTGAGCSSIKDYFRMNSNFGGERYEFEKCLPPDFSNALVVSSRKNDTVVVNFQLSAAGPMTSFHITLDIDSYPAYRYLTIDGDTYAITPSEK